MWPLRLTLSAITPAGAIRSTAIQSHRVRFPFESLSARRFVTPARCNYLDYRRWQKCDNNTQGADRRCWPNHSMELSTLNGMGM